MKSQIHITADCKNSGGKIMSSNKNAARRLSLLAGSSLMAASLTAGVFAGAWLVPTAAMAANECGDPSANGAGADALTCLPGAYPAGIDYSTTTNGSLTVILRDRVDTGTSNTVGVGGVRMFGKPGESMTLQREDTPGVQGDPRIINTAGRAIDVTSQGSGNVVVNLTDGDPTAGEPTTPAGTAMAPMRLTGGSDAIRAEATGAGNVSVIIAETGTQSGTSHPRAIINAGALAGGNGSGVVARSTSGAINVDVRGATLNINGTNGGGLVDAQSTTGNVSVAAFGSGAVFGIRAVSTSGNVTVTGGGSGRLYGVLAQTGGAGAVNVTIANGSSATSSTLAQAGIDTIAGTGSTLITITNGGVSSAAGSAIRSVSASTSATAAVNVQATGGSVSGWVDFSGVSAGGVTFRTAGAHATSGVWNPSGTSTFSGFNDTVTLGGAGVYNSAAGTVMNLGAGNDAFNIEGKYSVTTIIDDSQISQFPFLVTGGTTLNFGSGVDTMNVSGVLTVDYMTITGLEHFNNTGLVLLGAGRPSLAGVAPDYVTTDGDGDDTLSLPGVAYAGSGAGRIVTDVLLGGAQANCATPTGAGDCLDLRGGSTSGSTLVTPNYIGEDSALGGYDPIGVTVVDVAGGASAAEHFTLDPNSAGYVSDPLLGGTINRPGLFRYALRYDPSTQRHAIVGLPRSEVLEYAVLSGAAQSIWHMTSRTVTGRQTELREGPEADAVWLRTAGEYTQRNAETTFDSFGTTFALDTGYKLYAGTIMGGMDLISGAGDGYEYVTGLQIGYVSSSFDLNASDTSGRFTGATGGAYASFWSDWFFVDGAVNINGLALDYSASGLGSKTTTFLNSIGAAFEAGARTRITENTFAEPLAAASWVRTSFEEISLSGGEVQPANAESLRAGLGMRLGGTLAGEAVSATYFVTGRAWNEFEGEGGAVIHNPGAELSLYDEFTGAFGEAELGINVFNTANTISGFATTGVKWKDGYSTVNLSLGVRMAW